MAQRSKLLEYTPLPGWGAAWDHPNAELLVFRDNDQTKLDSIEDLPVLLGVSRHVGARTLSDAMDEYLRPRVASFEHELTPDKVCGFQGLRAEWTDGVHEIVSWMVDIGTALLLIEYSNNSRLQLDALQQARLLLSKLQVRPSQR